ncbi:MAG: CDP-diacylglycerol--serine O-phosphatidyltransferase [Candidatus Kapaibacteriales bacterium]
MIRITRSIVPNLLTLANLLSGFIALIYSSKQQYYLSATYVLIAAIFDMLDGITARLIKSASEFGVELDSLADAVSFGVVPSYMLYKVYFYKYGDIGLLFSALPLICGVLRLARFNIQTSTFEDKVFFTGLAIPAGAFTVISYIIFFHQKNQIPVDVKDFSILTVTILTSLAMISKIKFYNIPRPSKKYIREHPFISATFAILIIVSFITKGHIIFPFFAFYISGSVIRHYYLRIFKKRIKY